MVEAAPRCGDRNCMMRRLASALIALALAAPAAAQAPGPDLAAALQLRPDQRAAYARFQHDTAPAIPPASSAGRRRAVAWRP